MLLYGRLNYGQEERAGCQRLHQLHYTDVDSFVVTLMIDLLFLPETPLNIERSVNWSG
jgi:hypothetical protein